MPDDQDKAEQEAEYQYRSERKTHMIQDAREKPTEKTPYHREERQESKKEQGIGEDDDPSAQKACSFFFI